MYRSLIPLLFCAMCIVMPSIMTGGETPTTPSQAGQQLQSIAKQQTVFIPNRGQIVDSEGKLRLDLLFSTNGGNVKLYFRKTGISYVFARLEEQPKADSEAKISEATGTFLSTPRPDERPSENPTISMCRVDMEFVGCNENVEITGEDETKQYFNYYLAHCPQGITEVHGCRRVIYKNIYDNIDLVFHSSQEGVKYDFIVRPGGDVSDIKMKYNYADEVQSLAGQGLRISTALGKIEENPPVSYLLQNDQAYEPLMINGRPIRSKFNIEENTVRFAVPDYDENQTLVIDPYVLWSTFLGGEMKEHAEGVAVDEEQNTIVGGWTVSASFPAWPISKRKTDYLGATDAFLAKITPEGELEWYTYIGGTEFDRANAVTASNKYRYKVKADNDLFKSANYIITGYTRSINIPTTSEGSLPEGGNAFVASFNRRGEVSWFLIFGGSGDDDALDVAVSELGNITVVGKTQSMDFPLLPIGYYPSDWLYHKELDAFITSLDNEGNILWSRCWGGIKNDVLLSVDVNEAEQWLVGGWTESNDVPVTTALTLEGTVDMIIAKIDANGETIYSTYWGDTHQDYCTSVAFDQDGNIHVAGYAYSPNFYSSLSATPAQSVYGGGVYDGVLMKWNSDLSNIVWTTPIGGDHDDRIEDMTVDYWGNVWVVGTTNSSPTTNIGKNPLHAYQWDTSIEDWKILQNGRSLTAGIRYDAFITKYNPIGEIVWSSYYGKSGINLGVSIGSGYFYGVTIAGWSNADVNDQVPIFNAYPNLQAIPSVQHCDEAFVCMMREFSLPAYYSETPHVGTFGGIADASRLSIDNQNNIAIVGFTMSQNFPANPDAYQTELGIGASRNATITKLDSNSAPIWCTYYGGTSNAKGIAVAVNTNNDILIGVRIEEVFDSSVFGAGNLALFNKNGLFINQYSIDASGGSILITDVKFDSDGNIFTFGYTNANIYDGYSGGYDGFIAKFPSNLSSMEWWKYWGGVGDDEISEGEIGSGKEIVVVGSTKSATTFPLLGYQCHSSVGNQEAFVSKLDCTGNMLWSRLLEGEWVDIAKSVEIASDGTIVVVGITSSSDFPITLGAFQEDLNQGSEYWWLSDGFITYLDSWNGNLVWSTYLGGDEKDEAISVTLDQNNAAVILGSTDSYNFPTFQAFQDSFQPASPDQIHGYSDVFLTKFSANHQLEWSTYIGGPHTDYVQEANSIVTDVYNNYVFNFHFNSSSMSVSALPVDFCSRKASTYSNESIGAQGDMIFRFTPNGQLWNSP